MPAMSIFFIPIYPEQQTDMPKFAAMNTVYGQQIEQP
jgi:hypothetical protein